MRKQLNPSPQSKRPAPPPAPPPRSAGSNPVTLAKVLKERDRYRKALKDIKRHQEISGGALAKMGGTWNIADKALKGEV